VTGAFTLDLDHFRARVLQDCLTQATADYWFRRAQQFEDAAAREGDYHGNASTGEERWQKHQCNAACRSRLSGAYARCMATALACLRHAQLILDARPEEISPEVLAVLNELD
jgi:hypothetical protein